MIARTALMKFRKSSTIFLSNIVFLATSVTWTAPPPAWTQINPAAFETVVTPVLTGSTQLPLRWSYTLSPGSNLQSTGFSIYDGGFVTIGKIFHTSGITTVFDTNDYQTRFNISRSEVATLIINEVTEREEAVYECELTTTTNTWRYRVHVIVTGENQQKEIYKMCMYYSRGDHLFSHS